MKCQPIDITYGEHTYGTVDVYSVLGGKVSIGKFCSIADGVRIIMSDHNTNWITTYPIGLTDTTKKIKLNIPYNINKGDVKIGNDVWLGSECTIMSGVTIGDGCIIGAKTVVTKDMEPYSIVVGNPGKIVKKRFSNEDIEFLLELQWWNWPIDKIYTNTHILCSDNIEGLKGII
jgi:acetyltransferase-like isoleucine patch superfamily enzyme